MRPLKFLHRYWEWLVLIAVATALGLFLAGNQMWGFSTYVDSILALIGGLIAAITSFLFVTLVVPVLVLATAAVTAVAAAVTGLASILIGGIFTPVVVVLTGWVTTLFTWVAGTWLGTLLMPVYNLIAPLVLKVAPFLTAYRSGGKVLSWANRREAFKRFWRGQKPLRQPASTTRSAPRGRSSAQVKPANARVRARR